MPASQLLLRPIFWVGFGVFIVMGLYLYGRTLTREQTDLEKTRSALGEVKQDRDASARALTECQAKAAKESQRITELTAEIALLTRHNRSLEEARAQPVPQPELSAQPSGIGLPSGKEPNEEEEISLKIEDHPHVQNQMVGEAESLAPLQVLLVWEPGRGLAARKLQRLLKSRGATVTFEATKESQRDESAVYAPVELQATAEKIVRAASEVCALPLRYRSTRDRRIEIYLGRSKGSQE